MLDLYKNIKKYRIKRKLSQADLAKLTGYTDRSSIAKIEKGDVDLPQSKIMLFADALGVDAGTLMGNDGLDSSPGYYFDDETARMAQELYDDPDQRWLFRNTRNMPPEDMAAIKSMVEALRRKERG